MSKRFYGWIPDLPDQRDVRFTPFPCLTMGAAAPPRPHVDLRPSCPPVYDQGQLGSCTANAIGGAIHFERLNQGLPDWAPSRLFIYYNERAIEGTISSDSGAQIRDGIKSVATQGDCPEVEWPYDVTQFAAAPPAQCYTDALHYTVYDYMAVAQDLADTRACLAAGYPFVFGFTVYQSFESAEVAQTGAVPMPGPSESVVGGHAVMCVGYDDPSSTFICRNSWGAGWGQDGYFTIPYAYVMNPDLADDLWTIRLVH